MMTFRVQTTQSWLRRCRYTILLVNSVKHTSNSVQRLESINNLKDLHHLTTGKTLAF